MEPRAEGTERAGPAGPGPTPTRQQRNRLRTRARILEAAVDLFGRQGYQQTTVQEIADHADIALRTFYYHFDSKPAVAVAWFEDWADDLSGALQAQPDDASPLDLLAGALASMAGKGYPGSTTWEDGVGRPTMPPQAWALLEEADPALAGLVYQRLALGLRRVAELFRQRLGYGADDWEPYVIASSVVSMWFVAVHGTHDRLQRGAVPPSFHETVERAFRAYATGLEHLWAGRAPGQPPPSG